MDGDDPRHGSLAGYRAHRGDTTCQPCRDAMAKHRQLLILSGPTLLPANGAHLRIHALAALGWTYEEIAHAAGWPNRANTADVLKRAKIQRDTLARVTAAYDRLSMALPPDETPYRARNRAHAAARGWLPPLALDDDHIDDPTYRPTKHLSKTEREQLAAAGIRTDYDEAIVLRVLAGHPRPRQLTPAEAAEAARRLQARGVGPRELEHTYGLKADRYTTQTPAAAASTPAAAGHTSTTDQTGTAA